MFKVLHAVLAICFLALGLSSQRLNAQVKGCPAGTAVQGVDFTSKKILCGSVAGSEGFKVMDANNRHVGFLVDAGNLARLIDNEWTLLPYTRGGFSPSGGWLYFESTDCTGPRYLPPDIERYLPRRVITQLNGAYLTLYYPANATATERTVRSQLGVPADGTIVSQCVPPDTQFTAQMAIPQTTTLSNSPPFRIER